MVALLVLCVRGCPTAAETVGTKQAVKHARSPSNPRLLQNRVVWGFKFYSAECGHPVSHASPFKPAVLGNGGVRRSVASKTPFAVNR